MLYDRREGEVRQQVNSFQQQFPARNGRSPQSQPVNPSQHQQPSLDPNVPHQQQHNYSPLQQPEGQQIPVNYHQPVPAPNFQSHQIYAPKPFNGRNQNAPNPPNNQAQFHFGHAQRPSNSEHFPLSPEHSPEFINSEPSVQPDPLPPPKEPTDEQPSARHKASTSPQSFNKSLQRQGSLQEQLRTQSKNLPDPFAIREPNRAEANQPHAFYIEQEGLPSHTSKEPGGPQFPRRSESPNSDSSSDPHEDVPIRQNRFQNFNPSAQNQADLRPNNFNLQMQNQNVSQNFQPQLAQTVQNQPHSRFPSHASPLERPKIQNLPNKLQNNFQQRDLNHYASKPIHAFESLEGLQSNNEHRISSKNEQAFSNQQFNSPQNQIPAISQHSSVHNSSNHFDRQSSHHSSNYENQTQHDKTPSRTPQRSSSRIERQNSPNLSSEISNRRPPIIPINAPPNRRSPHHVSKPFRSQTYRSTSSNRSSERFPARKNSGEPHSVANFQQSHVTPGSSNSLPPSAKKIDRLKKRNKRKQNNSSSFRNSTPSLISGDEITPENGNVQGKQSLARSKSNSYERRKKIHPMREGKGKICFKSKKKFCINKGGRVEKGKEFGHDFSTLDIVAPPPSRHKSKQFLLVTKNQKCKAQRRKGSTNKVTDTGSSVSKSSGKRGRGRGRGNQRGRGRGRSSSKSSSTQPRGRGRGRNRGRRGRGRGNVNRPQSSVKKSHKTPQGPSSSISSQLQSNSRANSSVPFVPPRSVISSHRPSRENRNFRRGRGRSVSGRASSVAKSEFQLDAERHDDSVSGLLVEREDPSHKGQSFKAYEDLNYNSQKKKTES